jgi:hypothetical protein
VNGALLKLLTLLGNSSRGPYRMISRFASFRYFGSTNLLDTFFHVAPPTARSPS